MNNIKKIKAEIERLNNQSIEDQNRQVDRGLERAACVSYGKSKACKELLSFIDSLPEEPISDDLEEAANEIVNNAVPPLAAKYKDGTYVGGIRDYFDRKEFIDLVKAGAQWQKGQMMKDTITAHVFGREKENLYSVSRLMVTITW